MKHIEAEITVKLKLGLHARPSVLIHQTLSSLDLEELTLSNKEKDVDGTSLLGIMLLGAAPGSVLKVRAKGKDAQKAIDDLREILETDKWEEILNE